MVQSWLVLVEESGKGKMMAGGKHETGKNYSRITTYLNLMRSQKGKSQC